MGSGQLVFVRYALPLLVMGAILAGGAVARVGRPWRYALLLVGAKKMDEVRSFIVETGPRSPFYSYAIFYGNRQHNAGSMEVVRKFDCPYVILHWHALVYSSIDIAIAQSLAARGELITRFSPGSDMMSARYDPIDAYYLPIGSFGELEKTGPQIEIWRIGPDKPSSWGTLPRAFAQAYVRGAATRLEGGEIAEALALEPDHPEAAAVRRAISGEG